MNLIETSVGTLNQAKSFLTQISASDYTQPIPIISDSFIGQHTRHFIEFYQCLLTQSDKQVINYCHRKRDMDMETNPQVALDAIQNIIDNLNSLNLDTPIVLHTAKEGGEQLNSTIGRELYYNIEHCIHHLALIKVGLNIVSPDMTLPEHFGFAPSTVQHRKLLTQS